MQKVKDDLNRAKEDIHVKNPERTLTVLTHLVITPFGGVITPFGGVLTPCDIVVFVSAKNFFIPAGNRSPALRATGENASHYTTEFND